MFKPIVLNRDLAVHLQTPDAPYIMEIVYIPPRPRGKYII